jgi:hypothetical protein
MKLFIILLFLAGFLFSYESVKCQAMQEHSSGLPLKNTNSVAFANDVTIYNDPTQNQRQVALASSFNGWLYAEYSYMHPEYLQPTTELLKSTDNGLTWTGLINEIFVQPYTSLTSFDIAIVGDSVSNLKIILAWIATNSPAYGIGDMWVCRFDEATGALEQIYFFLGSVYSVALCSDYPYAAAGASGHSFGLLYSKHYQSRDSIVFMSSGNGGATLDHYQGIARAEKHFHNVALSYGRSATANSGRYFAAWEEKDAYESNLGHIYTAHSEPGFNSPFTTPFMIDGLDSTIYNNVKNPTIACQVNNLDNDSTDLTEVLLFDKYVSANSNYDVQGYYNMKATTTNNFRKFSIDPSPDSKQQPSVKFNPYDSTFFATYDNYTRQKLPFVCKNFNMQNPDIWQVVSDGYNDNSNLLNPYPKVALDFDNKKGACVWSVEGDGGNGGAMFDGYYNIYEGTPGSGQKEGGNSLKIYPNPCKNTLNISFSTSQPGTVKISLNDLLGNQTLVFTNQRFTGGRHLLRYDISDLPRGSYIITMKSENFIDSKKIQIIR